MRILTEEVLPAAVKEFGILPKNFELGRNLDEYDTPDSEQETTEKSDESTD